MVPLAIVSAEFTGEVLGFGLEVDSQIGRVGPVSTVLGFDKSLLNRAVIPAMMLFVVNPWSVRLPNSTPV